MGEPTTYLGASSQHLFCENYEFQANTTLKVFQRDETCTSITWIDVQNCSGILDQNTFTNLPNLKIIKFYNCNLRMVHKNTLSSMVHLETVEMRRTYFYFDQNTFKTCENIKTITFIEVEGNFQVPALFKDLQNLESLTMNHIISDIELANGIFSGLHNLLYLFIENCNITAFSESVFSPLESLKFFYFTHNILKIFNPNSFMVLKTLVTLGLYENVVKSKENTVSSDIFYQIFQNLPKLETISFPEECMEKLELEKIRSLKKVQLIIGRHQDDCAEFIKSKNIEVEWITDNSLVESVDFSNPNIQICA